MTYRRLETVQLAPPWYRGRIVLIGDAAHAGPPTLAQGAAMAFEDAVVLGEVLRAAPGDIPGALAAFESRRRPRCEQVRTRTRERDGTQDVPPTERDPMLRSRGQAIFADQYRELVQPL